MKKPRPFTFLALILLGCVDVLAAALVADPPHVCEYCEGWARPREPFQVFGNTWYVGGGVSAVLITSKQGHVLIDGGLTQTAPQIAANIAKLGFRLEDVKLIVNSHTHYDHAGGIAALQKASGAKVAASPAARRALEAGGPLQDDPQFAFGPKHNNYPRVAKVRAVKDGETLRVGDLAITVHFTPGHTPGGTSWTWKSCEKDQCLNLVYADSLNSVSAPGFRFSGGDGYPSRVASFEQSMKVVEGLDCDILLTPHPEAFDVDARLARRAQDPASNPFIDKNACKAYAEGARQRLAKRVAEEGSAAAPAPK
jgi:metallo-beta-lactamase class B